MTNRERIRGVGLLCCHCVRNVAYYRAGWIDSEFVSVEDFWRNTNSNFLDIAVLEWCKMFADWNGKHHWRKVVPTPDGFHNSLFEAIIVSEEKFSEHLETTRTYRDKFVAHLDAERTMHLPTLDVFIDSSVFLYGIIQKENRDYFADAPQNLREFYEQRLEHGQNAYPHAT